MVMATQLAITIIGKYTNEMLMSYFSVSLYVLYVV